MPNQLRDLYYKLDEEVKLYKTTKNKIHLSNIRSLQNEIMDIVKEEEIDIEIKNLYKTYTIEEMKQMLNGVTSKADSALDSI